MRYPVLTRFAVRLLDRLRCVLEFRASVRGQNAGYPPQWWTSNQEIDRIRRVLRERYGVEVRI